MTRGAFALVDDVDYKELSKFKWCFDGRYALRREYTDGRGVAVWMHRIINKTPNGYETDHINWDKLDNRRSNLRTVTARENKLNTPLQPNNRSGWRGVHWDTRKQRWIVQHCKKYRGSFTELSDAIAVKRQAVSA